MPPLRGAKINSGFLLVRRRFDLLLFRGAQLIATMHTYFCSRPRKIAAATFTYPSTNPPRFFSLRVHCAHCTTCSLNACTHRALTVRLLFPFLSLLLALPSPFFQFSLPLSAPLLLRGKLAAIAVARFSKSRLPTPQPRAARPPRDLFLLSRHQRNLPSSVIIAALLYVLVTSD